MIANINYVKSVMGELRAKKKFGQNFLVDANVVDRIAQIACTEDLKTVEIGPGLGALTEMLLKYSKSVDAYEIDEDMYERVRQGIDDAGLTVYLIDFLEAGLDIYKEKVNVCGNLPYYVTTPILFRIIESGMDINRITIMVQKEVGERLTARPNSEEYGALSVEVQYLYDVKTRMNISRNVFYPVPNVDSIVVTLDPGKRRYDEQTAQFFAFVKDCFRMRRKTIYNNLRDLYDGEKILVALHKTGIDEKARAQSLAIEQLQALYDELKEARAG